MFFVGSFHVRPQLSLSALHPLFSLLHPRTGCCFTPSTIPYSSIHSRVCVISHLLILLCLALLFVSYHPSILLAGWPKSCSVLELCSGRDKLSVALSAATHILSCPSALTVCMRKRQRGGGGGEGGRRRRRREMERRRRRTNANRSIVRQTGIKTFWHLGHDGMNKNYFFWLVTAMNKKSNTLFHFNIIPSRSCMHDCSY